MSEIRARLVAAISKRTGRVPALTDRLSGLGVDSVELAELLAKLEQDFGFQADADIFDVETVEELVDYIEARRR